MIICSPVSVIGYCLGVEGGFDPDQNDKDEYEEFNEIVILPQFYRISLDQIEDIPSLVSHVSKLMNAAGIMCLLCEAL